MSADSHFGELRDTGRDEARDEGRDGRTRGAGGDLPQGVLVRGQAGPVINKLSRECNASCQAVITRVRGGRGWGVPRL